MRIANHVVLNKLTGQWFIDGVEVPYYVADAPRIDGLENDAPLPTVWLGLHADRITVIGERGQVESTCGSVVPDDEWAREMARRVVRDGLVDVLCWLERSQWTT